MKRHPNNKLFVGLLIQDQCPKERRWRICAQKERKSPIIVPSIFCGESGNKCAHLQSDLSFPCSFTQFHLTVTCCTCGIPQALCEEWAKTFYCCWSVAKSRPTPCDPMNCSSQASLAFTTSRGLLKLTCIESEMPSSHLILCCVI